MARDKTDTTDKTPVATIATVATKAVKRVGHSQLTTREAMATWRAGMTRKVRGLLGVFEAEANGESWEPELPSPDYVPGMGLGATVEATRWAWLGWKHETEEAIRESIKRPAHRPKLPALQSIDVRRAEMAWRFAQSIRRLSDFSETSFTNRELIGLLTQFEGYQRLPKRNRIFPQAIAKLENSISNGKKILGIDAGWKTRKAVETL